MNPFKILQDIFFAPKAKEALPLMKYEIIYRTYYSSHHNDVYHTSARTDTEARAALYKHIADQIAPQIIQCYVRKCK
jgi:hypothetical protein